MSSGPNALPHRGGRRLMFGVLGFALVLGLGGACNGGQSGTEGDPPAPPCAYQGALLRATVIDVGANGVRLEVGELVKAGDALTGSEGQTIFSGEAAPGEVLRGRLGVIYAWSHEFVSGESVAALPSAWGNELSFELMPMQGDRVLVQWGTARFDSTLDELAADDCPEVLMESVDPGSDVRVGKGCALRGVR